MKKSKDYLLANISDRSSQRYAKNDTAANVLKASKPHLMKTS